MQKNRSCTTISHLMYLLCIKKWSRNTHQFISHLLKLLAIEARVLRNLRVHQWHKVSSAIKTICSDQLYSLSKNIDRRTISEMKCKNISQNCNLIQQYTFIFRPVMFNMSSSQAKWLKRNQTESSY